MNHIARKSDQRAFTLVELLTVIAIIVILTAIIVPTVSKIRASSRAAACLSNLRQIGAAGALYSNDNNRRLVPTSTGTNGQDAVTWRGHLLPYLQTKDVLFCPADVSTVANDNTRYLSPSSYGIPLTTALHDYLRGNNPRNLTLSDVVKPAQTIFVCDIGMVANPSDSPVNWVQRASTSSYGYATTPADPSWSSGTNWNAFPRHASHVNAVFYDGHAQALHIQTDLIDHTASGDPLCRFRNQ